MSLSSGELLIKESLTEVDPELATPQGHPLEIRHFNWVWHCQQEAPLPREQPVPPHLSVSVLKVLTLETMSSQLLVLIFFLADLKWKRKHYFRFIVRLWTVNSGDQEGVRRLALIREVPEEWQSWKGGSKIPEAPTWWQATGSPEWRCPPLCCNGLFAETSDISDKWDVLKDSQVFTCDLLAPLLLDSRLSSHWAGHKLGPGSHGSGLISRASSSHHPSRPSPGQTQRDRRQAVNTPEVFTIGQLMTL